MEEAEGTVQPDISEDTSSSKDTSSTDVAEVMMGSSENLSNDSDS